MISADIERYAEEHTSPEPEILKQLYRDTHLKMLYARMLSGHMQGRLLSMISRMIKPEKVLEIGTFTGYSAICLGEGLCEGGILHTIEVKPELEDMILSYFDKAGLIGKIRLHIGNALELIPTVKGPFDIVFIDADKENYLNYYKVKPGGFILADNVLWDGKVLKNDAAKDKETRGVVEFNEFVGQDSRVENLLLPLRDGLMIMQKIK